MSKRRKILIVDDEPDITKFLQKQLSRTYTVETANSGAEAISQYKERFYDVLLTDVRMPGIDGIQLLKTIKNISTKSQVILMSGYSEINMVIEGVNMGAFAFVTKPLDIDTVEERIRHAIALVQSYENQDQVIKEMRNELVMQTLFTQRLSALAAMAGSIAHELYQPLSGINIYCRTLERMVEKKRQVAPDYLMETMKKIGRQVEKASEVIDHIKEFSSGSSDTESEAMFLAEAVERACGFFRAELSANDIELIIKISTELEFKANRNRFEQVVINLMANAKDCLVAKHGGETGLKDHIIIQGKKTKSGIHLDFIDSGTGIPEESQEGLFEPFVTSKGETGGSGLGLFICRRLLQEMGATIELLTTSLKGTTFRLRFP